MRAARTDSNQQAIADALRAAGWQVVCSHRIGQGYPDLTASKAGRTVLFECKVPGGRLTVAEAGFFWAWQGEMYVVHSAEEALEKVQA